MDDIDIFADEFSGGRRWDTDQNAKLLNIVFHGGTFGNFLKYFLDKFSLLSPNIEETPFNDIGTSHGHVKYSGLIQRYHQNFIKDNEDYFDLPVCVILPQTEKDFLYLKTSAWYRGNDAKISPNFLWSKKIKDVPNFLKIYSDKIISLYKLNEIDYIPKFLVRDWYKLEFLDELKKSHNYRWFEILKNHRFFKKQKTYHFPLESFFNIDVFIENVRILDDFFQLKLDFKRLPEMREIFHQSYNLDQNRQECKLVFEIIKGIDSKNKIDIPELDVSSEAYLYAHIEKTTPFVQTPLTNNFFKDTNEINEYIRCYPNHYKAMNPNMPKFNGIDNPFYLNVNKK